jgi:large subunit ribosomal protein L28
MARICELTGKGPIKGSHIWRSGKAKKKGGIGTHVTAIRVAASAIKKGLVTKAPKRTWKKANKAAA